MDLVTLWKAFLMPSPKKSKKTSTGRWVCCWCNKELDTSAYKASSYEYCPHCAGSFSWSKPVPANKAAVQKPKKKAGRREECPVIWIIEAERLSDWEAVNFAGCTKRSARLRLMAQRYFNPDVTLRLVPYVRRVGK